MASLLHYSKLPHTHHQSTSSALTSLPTSHSTAKCNLSRTSNANTSPFHPLKFHRSQLSPKEGLSCRSALDEVTFIESSESKEAKTKLIGSLKLKLLSAVSGLNRGLAASEDDLQNADAAAKELENVAGPVDLTNDLDQLQGRWRLIYSSAFSSRTLGGSRPGLPTGRLLPINLGQVFQRIDILSKDFDNIVELELGTPWPLPQVEVTATLAHKFEIIGSSKVKIVFEKTTVKTTGNLSQLPPLEVPRIPDALRPQSNTGSGEFDVTYLDSDMRITRGDRGELRVFVIA